MSDSWSCENKLVILAEELEEQAVDLRRISAVLKTLRESQGNSEKIISAKKWARDWLKNYRD